MRTRVELRVGRVTRRTWAFPALAAAVALMAAFRALVPAVPTAWLLTDVGFWSVLGAGAVASASLLAAPLAGWLITLGRGPRVGLVFATAAAFALHGTLPLRAVAWTADDVSDAVAYARAFASLEPTIRSAPEMAARRAAGRGKGEFLVIPSRHGRRILGIDDEPAAGRFGVRVLPLPLVPFTPGALRAEARLRRWSCRYNREMAVLHGIASARAPSPAACVFRGAAAPSGAEA
jgi:hypothetical protein